MCFKWSSMAQRKEILQVYLRFWTLQLLLSLSESAVGALDEPSANAQEGEAGKVIVGHVCCCFVLAASSFSSSLKVQ